MNRIGKVVIRIRLKSGRSIWILRKIRLWCQIVFGIRFASFSILASMNIPKISLRKEFLKTISAYSCPSVTRSRTAFFSRSTLTLWPSQSFTHSFMHFPSREANLTTSWNNSSSQCFRRYSRGLRSATRRGITKNGHWIWVLAIY